MNLPGEEEEGETTDSEEEAEPQTEPFPGAEPDLSDPSADKEGRADGEE